MRNKFNHKFEVLGAQIEESTQILKKLVHLVERGKVTTRITPRLQAGGNSVTKPIVVKVDYDTRKDFRLLAFKRKMKDIWKG